MLALILNHVPRSGMVPTMLLSSCFFCFKVPRFVLPPTAILETSLGAGETLTPSPNRVTGLGMVPTVYA